MLTPARLYLIVIAMPLLLAFFAAAAFIGHPDRSLGFIAMLGIAVHALFAVTLWGASGIGPRKPKLENPPMNKGALAELTQLQTAQAYLLGALKLHLTDEKARSLAADAEESARHAQQMLETLMSQAPQASSDASKSHPTGRV